MSNKITRNNQSHGNKKQTDRNQRGWGQGITAKKGKKGHERTHIKDPWAKTTGVGGGD